MLCECVWVDKYVPDYIYTYVEGNFYGVSAFGLVDGDGYYFWTFGFEWNK